MDPSEILYIRSRGQFIGVVIFTAASRRMHRPIVFNLAETGKLKEEYPFASLAPSKPVSEYQLRAPNDLGLVTMEMRTGMNDVKMRCIPHSNRWVEY